MKKFKTYFLLLILALIFFVLSYYVSKEIQYTLNVFATYFVMSAPNFYKCIAILTLTSGLIYFVLDGFKVILNQLFSKIHIFGTILLLLTLIFFTIKNNATQTIILGGTISRQIDYSCYLKINLMMIIFLQSLFFINIFVAQIKNFKTLAPK